VVAGIQLFQQRDLPQSGHGHSIVVQRDPNFLQRHYITGDHISGSVDRSISTWKKSLQNWIKLAEWPNQMVMLIRSQNRDTKKKPQKQGQIRTGETAEIRIRYEIKI